MQKKSSYNKTIDTIDEVFSNAIRNGIFHLYTEDEQLDGRTLTIRGQKVINFGSCSYLGLEFNEDVINGCIDATRKFGTQLSSSRSYMSIGLYKELEYLFQQLFKTPVVISPTTTLGHHAAIPVIVDDNDAIILDFQVHASVQDAVSKLFKRGIPTEVIRHSNLDDLEHKIKLLGPKYKKIWFMADGIFSMYGDPVPIKELMMLMEKYPQLHLYIDDSHGMSWTGPRGSGFIYSQIDPHPKVIVVTSLAKGFGIAGGGVISSPNEEIIRKIRTCGSSMIFSGPLGPPTLGAAIASAKIHLSNEFDLLQNKLYERLAYTKSLLKEYNLPLISEDLAPIFFVGVSSLKLGYNMDKRLLNEGYYANIALFPAVPVRRTGLRITNTLHHTKDDIKGLVEAIAYHLPIAMAEEGVTKQQIYKAFDLDLGDTNRTTSNQISTNDFIIQHENTIKNIDTEEWNKLIGHHGAFDWNGNLLIEEAFSNNEKPEDNWTFHYYIMRDHKGKPILATQLCAALTKDDMFDPANISTQIEEKRKDNPYYLTSKALVMGNLLSTGNHLYIDRTNPQWKKAFKVLLDKIQEEKEREKATAIYLRDFNPNDIELKEFLGDSGYLRVDLPDNHEINDLSWQTTDHYLKTLKQRDRNKIKNDVLSHLDAFEVSFIEKPTEEQIKLYYQLYLNIKNKNTEINIFEYPESLFKKIATDPNWDIIELRLKTEGTGTHGKIAAVGLCYKANHYYTSILGLDYSIFNYSIYRQMLYQAIMRGKQLGKKKIVLGLTASIEKQRFGAKTIPNVIYAQLDDNFNRGVINLMGNHQNFSV